MKKLIEWAKREEAIRAVILQGSRADDSFDALSDYDLVLYCTSYEGYVEETSWLAQLGEVLIPVQETQQIRGLEFPALLVLFEGGVKVDFLFLPCDRQLPDGPFLVLLDKDSLLTHLHPPKEKLAQRPSEREFLRIVQEFWFEAYHVAKYLLRRDLWSAQFRLHAARQFFLQILEWQEEAKRQWQSRLPPLGKNLRSWAGKKTWGELQGIFAPFDDRGIQKALLALLALFQNISLDTAKRLSYPYPHDLAQKMTDLLRKM